MHQYIASRTIFRCCLKVETDRNKFGFGYGAETGDIFSFGYSSNREARFRPTFGYGQKYKRSKLPLLAIS